MTETPFIAWYGDDLTGSTDVMEALSLRGVETVLFTGVPTEGQLARFPTVRALGIAGTSRSETPAWMDEHLPPVFRWLGEREAGIVHYKVCSTFDSAPHVGSIGRAIEIGRRVLGEKPVPILVGAPQLRRHTAFGNLFAAFRGETFRIDRHPVMSRHPVTPMREADLRRHLADQTDLSVALLDLVATVAPDADARLGALLAEAPGAVLIDVADAETQRAAGRHLKRLAAAGHRFVVGSSGVEYALADEVAAPPSFPPLAPAERLAVVSGSCSPTTERQIRHAEARGFALVPADPRAFAAGDEAAAEATATQALAELAAGRSVIVNTALGPDTDLGEALAGIEGARHRIGQGLGRLQARLVRETGLRRAVIAGGDTSSHALQALGVFALTMRLPFPQTPGSPVTLAWSDDPAFDGIELAMKGGQVGDDAYFVDLRGG
ncbi:four-carbon acid sugar kinase family protein [Aureimonas leprariae]|uniref:Four-carbon acid sugar kinase family protein n=1 Tax=Plantimonas leprariae TaxID=2615207 RepID=A0A7V7PL61_9HYPH|nr:four-carbon acid sugar kinase family protein [Aureimonas leprariae]KAB0676879.1 four-carbon acid sugar kinase family protein [Aureimonas leprariae]